MAKSKPEIRRITEYMISGGAYFWTGYLVFFLCDKGLGFSLWWAKLLANISGWTVNYLLQRYWVFKNPKLNQHQTEVTIRYAIITLVNFVLDYFIIYGLKMVGITPYIGQFISSGFFTVWNYLWYKFWVFPEKFAVKSPKVKRTVRPIAHHPHGPAAYRRVR
ncbi:MAG: GtrA family protein [Candidatus Saccharibacteria bacterium]|nr:GtrA family protein [Candidatus Saccharibacteria bacterium]